MSVDLIRFEDFELDSRNYCLRQSGANLKLERIPLELWLLLASRAGSLVTREEIIEKLWGKDVYLDTENAINTAIRKIRLVLGDDPVQPRFVQTVTGRGYRFIARVADQSKPATREGRGTPQSVPVTLAASVVTEIEVPGAGFDLKSPRGDVFSGPSNNLDGHLIPSTQRERYWLIAVMATALIGVLRKNSIDDIDPSASAPAGVTFKGRGKRPTRRIATSF